MSSSSVEEEAEGGEGGGGEGGGGGGCLDAGPGERELCTGGVSGTGAATLPARQWLHGTRGR